MKWVYTASEKNPVVLYEIHKVDTQQYSNQASASALGLKLSHVDRVRYLRLISNPESYAMKSNTAIFNILRGFVTYSIDGMKMLNGLSYAIMDDEESTSYTIHSMMDNVLTVLQRFRDEISNKPIQKISDEIKKADEYKKERIENKQYDAGKTNDVIVSENEMFDSLLKTLGMWKNHLSWQANHKQTSNPLYKEDDDDDDEW